MPTVHLLLLSPETRWNRYSQNEVRAWSDFTLALSTESNTPVTSVASWLPNLVPTLTGGYYENEGEDDQIYHSETPNLNFLAEQRMHESDLHPIGISYYGRFYPATWEADCGGVLATEPFSCAHCAYLRARVLLSERNDTRSIPTVYWLAPDSRERLVVIGTPSACATTKIEFTELGCSNCGRPGHNSRGCSVSQRFYDRIGVEIEGRFLNIRDVRQVVERDGLHHCGDASIRRGRNSECQPMEIQTQPTNLAGALRQVAKFYPDEADESCGLHVHVSFRDFSNIGLLATEEFVRYFEQRWQEWGARMQLPADSEFYKRLRGDNQYCGRNQSYDLERPYRADRYRQLNFTAWEEHQTVECRLLPMFLEARVSLAAITELINIYEDWLGGAALACLPKAEYAEFTSLTVFEQKFSEVVAIDATVSTAQYYHTSELEVTELPLPAPGHERVALSPAMLGEIMQILRREI